MGNMALCGAKYVRIKREDGETLKLRPLPELNAKSVLVQYPGHSIFDKCSGKELSKDDLLECGHVYIMLRSRSSLQLSTDETAERRNPNSVRKHGRITAVSFPSGDGGVMRLKIRMTKSELAALLSATGSDANAQKILTTLMVKNRACPRLQQMRWRPSLDSISELVSPRL